MMIVMLADASLYHYIKQYILLQFAYVLWSRASVCLSVCLSAAACAHYCTDPDVTWGSDRDAP